MELTKREQKMKQELDAARESAGHQRAIWEEFVKAHGSKREQPSYEATVLWHKKHNEYEQAQQLYLDLMGKWNTYLFRKYPELLNKIRR